MELGNKAPALCLWCFDLLHLNGVRITPLTLAERKALLANLVLTVGDKHLQFSGDFPDPLALLRTCQRMGLEGIVSKRKELSLPIGTDPRLAEGEDRDLAYREPRAVGIVREETTS